MNPEDNSMRHAIRVQVPILALLVVAAAGLSKFERATKEAEGELLAAFKKTGEDKLVKAYALHSLCLGMKDDPSKLLPELTARLDPTVEKDADVRIEHAGAFSLRGVPVDALALV